ncbi:hypothetical protein FKM82_011375 [Ascaphus truei]
MTCSYTGALMMEMCPFQACFLIGFLHFLTKSPLRGYYRHQLYFLEVPLSYCSSLPHHGMKSCSSTSFALENVFLLYIKP